MSDLSQTSCAFAPIVLHMHKKFEVNQTKIKCGCQSERKVVSHDSKSDLPLESNHFKIPKVQLLRSTFFVLSQTSCACAVQ